MERLKENKMSSNQFKSKKNLDPLKFKHPLFTANGDRRADVSLTKLRTLWFNTGSLCNITCQNCFMESSPTNNRLAYLTLAEVESYLFEIEAETLGVEEIAFTGGEPFMNQDLIDMMDVALRKGYRVLVLTNAMKPLLNKKHLLSDLLEKHSSNIKLRVSIDHFTQIKHETVRGVGSWVPMLEGLRWLSEIGANMTVAGRNCWNERELDTRKGYFDLFANEKIAINANDPADLILFPEMDSTADVPEITTHCWDILKVTPESLMCATSRMIVKHRGADRTSIMPCTLLPYDPVFELGKNLVTANKTVQLNHPHCAKFCVLGGATCSTD
jgi:sulfatase maturation enzyme AslB (radical SAM superfamily)